MNKTAFTNIIFGLLIAGLAFEWLLAIPVLGATIVIGTYWTILFLTLLIHVAGLVLRIIAKEGDPIAAPIVGILASSLGWIPLVGWGLHLAAAITYTVEITKRNKRKKDLAITK